MVAATIKGWLVDCCYWLTRGLSLRAVGRRSPHSDEYCGTHMGASPCAKKGKRVPCPVDPNHTVFEQQLSAHVKVRQCFFYSRTIIEGRFATFTRDGRKPVDKMLEGCVESPERTV